MWYVALSLGAIGSLHCVGMCGPLAIAFGSSQDSSLLRRLWVSLSYHAGRTATYVAMGILFGLVGNAVVIAGLQQWLSILIGVLMVISFVMSIDIDSAISRSSIGQRWQSATRSLVHGLYQRSSAQPRWLLGMVNGLLPCGLVYLALAGSLASESLVGGGTFMLLFGLGTVPSLVVLTVGSSTVSPSIRKQYRKLLPYVTLLFGLFMIYRGMVVEMPAELDFWTAIKHPVMCH